MTGCGSVEKQQFFGTTQGSYYSIIYYDEQNRDFSGDFDSIFKVIESTLSLWDENSMISRVNRNDESIVLNQIFIDNFNYAMRAAELSEGYFDPTVGPLVSAWGFHFKEGLMMTPEMVDSIRQYVGYKKIKIEDGKVIKENPNMTLDFNAVAQGYTTDMIGDFLLLNGVENFLVDVGGEILAKGNKPNGDLWKVGIEKPSEDKDAERIVQEIVELKDKSIVTSGNYRKYVERNGKRYLNGLALKPIELAILDGFACIKSSVIIAQPYTGRDEDVDSGPILGISKPMPIDFMGYTLEELRAADAARPAKRPKGHTDILHEVANHNQDLLKKWGDHVIFPQVANDYAKGLFEIRDGKTFYCGKQVKTVEYTLESITPVTEV